MNRSDTFTTQNIPERDNQRYENQDERNGKYYHIFSFLMSSLWSIARVSAVSCVFVYSECSSCSMIAMSVESLEYDSISDGICAQLCTHGW